MTPEVAYINRLRIAVYRAATEKKGDLSGEVPVERIAHHLRRDPQIMDVTTSGVAATLRMLGLAVVERTRLHRVILHVDKNDRFRDFISPRTIEFPVRTSEGLKALNVPGVNVLDADLLVRVGEDPPTRADVPNPDLRLRRTAIVALREAHAAAPWRQGVRLIDALEIFGRAYPQATSRTLATLLRSYGLTVELRGGYTRVALTNSFREFIRTPVRTAVVE